MLERLSSLLRLAFLSFTLGVAAAGAGLAAPSERNYCTQVGPLLIRIDEARAAGLLTRIDEASFTVFIGAIVDGVFAGHWLGLSQRGKAEIVFSEDLSTFEGRLVEAEPDGAIEPDAPILADRHAVEHLQGFLPPAGDPQSFRIDGVQYRCR